MSEPAAAPATPPRAGLLLAGLALALAVAVVLGVESTSLEVTPLLMYDEGIALTEAMRLAGGELPWRDYDPVYGPLEPLLLVPSTWAFGPQLLALRLLRGACLAGLVAVIAACAWRLGARVSAVAAAAALVVCAGQLAHPVLLPIFASALLLDLAGPDLRRGPLAAAGALTGVAMLLRLEFGALALGALVAAVIVERLLAPSAAPSAWRTIARALLHVGAGALPFVVGWVVLVVVAGPARFVAHSRDTRASMPYRELPYPLPPPVELEGFDVARHWFLFTLPLLVALAAPLVLAGRAFAARRAPGAPPPRLAVTLAVLLVGLLPYALWRSDRAHVFPAFCAAVALGAAALVGLEARAWPRSGGLALRVAGAALALLLLGRVASAVQVASTTSGYVWSSLRGLRGVLVPAAREAAWAELVRVVDEHAGAPDAPVFVGCADATARTIVPQHGRVFANDAFTYVVLGRPVGTRHHCFIPGVTTTEAKQAQVVADLDARRVRVAVLAFGTYVEEPNLSLTEPGARHLDRALRDGWAPVADLHPLWCVLVRTD